MKFGVAKIIFLFFSLIFLFLVSSQDAKACEFGDCDLEPVDFNLQPDYPIMDEPLDINFTVVNNGAEPANNVSLIVWYSDSECDMQQETCEVIYETILMGVGDKGIQIEFDCTPDEGCTGSGDKVITVEVDYMDSISETDENNNKIIYEFTIYEYPLANLKYAEGDFSITIVPEVPAVGDTVSIYATFENVGGSDCSNFYVSFTEIYDDEEKVLGEAWFGEEEDGMVERDGGQGQTIFNWEPSEIGNYTIEVYLDSREDVDEYIDEDNVYNLTFIVREHTPELSFNDEDKIGFEPVDSWLKYIYEDHSVILTVIFFNNDYVVSGENITVRFYDVLEDGTLAIIGDSLVDFISNASTLAGGEPWPARANSSVIWDKLGGTNRVGNHSIYVEIDPDNEIEEWNDEDNNMTFTLEVLESKADLIVSNIFIDDNNPVRGIPSDIVITVYNNGSRDALDFNIDLKIDSDLIFTWSITLLEGDNNILTFNHTWSTQQPIVSVHMDTEKAIEELDEDNNAKSISVDVASPEYDLTLVSIDTQTEIFRHEHLKLVVEIHNNLAAIPSLKLSLLMGNSTIPEVQRIGQGGADIYFIYSENLLYDEIRFVAIYWNTTSYSGLHNITVLAEINNSTFQDKNMSDNSLNISIFVKPRSYQLSVEMRNIPEYMFLNDTLSITVSALNFGPDICCKSPPNYACPTDILEDNASEECVGAEIAVYIDGEEFQIYRTKPLGRVNGEEVRVFKWKPDKPGTYNIEARIDPGYIVDEFNEMDNIAYAQINVSVQEVVVIVPEVEDSDDSFISEPLFWVPLVTLSAIGAGMLIYNKISGDGDDMFDYYEDDNTDTSTLSKQSGFRFDPTTGKTYDSQTGEVIESGRKKD